MEDNKKVVLVTGASGKLGEAIARLFAEKNYVCILNYSREKSKEKIDNIIVDLKKKGHNAEGYMCDISNSEDVSLMVKNIIEKYKKIDVLVNNAGITKDTLSLRMTDEDFSRVLDVNLKGAFYASKSCLQYMIKNRSGNIINISSVVGLHGNAGQANYSASKAGLIGLTKSMAREFAQRNISINAVAPGAVRTDMFESLGENIKKSIVDMIPLKRVAEAQEVAEVVYFLTTSPYITGQVIQVDGGMFI